MDMSSIERHAEQVLRSEAEAEGCRCDPVFEVVNSSEGPHIPGMSVTVKALAHTPLCPVRLRAAAGMN